MSSYQLDNALTALDKAMRMLRDSMKGIQIRTAGFKRDHDEFARAAAGLSVLLLDAKPSMKTVTVARPKGRRR